MVTQDDLWLSWFTLATFSGCLNSGIHSMYHDVAM